MKTEHTAIINYGRAFVLKNSPKRFILRFLFNASQKSQKLNKAKKLFHA